MASRSVTCFRNLHYFFSALWCSSEVSSISILISSLTDPSLDQLKWSVLQTSDGEGQVIRTGLSFHSEAGTDRHTPNPGFYTTQKTYPKLQLTTEFMWSSGLSVRNHTEILTVVHPRLDPVGQEQPRSQTHGEHSQVGGASWVCSKTASWGDYYNQGYINLLNYR